MSDMVLHHLLCDWSENCETQPPFVGVAVEESRSEARKAGWRCDETGDWCPDHAASAVRSDREPQPEDGPDYHAEHAAWQWRQDQNPPRIAVSVVHTDRVGWYPPESQVYDFGMPEPVTPDEEHMPRANRASPFRKAHFDDYDRPNETMEVPD